MNNKNLRLPVTRQWFNMTKQGIKREDYRKITPYWCKRLLDIRFSKENWESGAFEEFVEDLQTIHKKDMQA